MIEENSNQNAFDIEIEDIGEDLQADTFINLDEYGQPVKNDDAMHFFHGTKCTLQNLSKQNRVHMAEALCSYLSIAQEDFIV